jgi:rhodanese-related sulfurtransferase
MFEMIDKLIDKYFLGSGTRSIRPENEVARLIGNGAFILDVRFPFEAKKGIAPGATNISLLQLNRHLLERNGFKVINGGGYETVRKIAMSH